MASSTYLHVGVEPELGTDLADRPEHPVVVVAAAQAQRVLGRGLLVVVVSGKSVVSSE